MSTGCALDENWVNIVVKNSPVFFLGMFWMENFMHWSKFNIEMPCVRYMNFHYKDSIVSPQKLARSVYITLYWIIPLTAIFALLWFESILLRRDITILVSKMSCPVVFPVLSHKLLIVWLNNHDFKKYRFLVSDIRNACSTKMSIFLLCRTWRW